jgi:purine-binding chemotaxis protein CheW
MTGILVDAVSDIITLAGADIQAPPEIMRETQDSYVNGIAVMDGRMVTLLEMGELTAAVPSELPTAA